MKKVYKKLVRDRIPEIIEKKGSVPEIRILSPDEYLHELKNKFQEEFQIFSRAVLLCVRA